MLDFVEEPSLQTIHATPEGSTPVSSLVRWCGHAMAWSPPPSWHASSEVLFECGLLAAPFRQQLEGVAVRILDALRKALIAAPSHCAKLGPYSLKL